MTRTMNPKRKAGGDTAAGPAPARADAPADRQKLRVELLKIASDRSMKLNASVDIIVDLAQGFEHYVLTGQKVPPDEDDEPDSVG